VAGAFVIRPYGVQEDNSGKKIDFDRVNKELIVPALKATGFDGATETGDLVYAGNIREDMFRMIINSDIVVADITIRNANVFYELGIRHAIRKRHTILLKGKTEKEQTPFDLLTDRYLKYDLENPGASVEDLIKTIKSSLSTEDHVDSPVFQMLPGFEEADASILASVPRDFREQVERAQAAKDLEKLKKLAGTVQSERYKWEGLKLVAQAQFKLKDYQNARDSWEEIISFFEDDVDANKALANIYQRLFISSNDPVLFEQSEQSIEHLLQNPRITKEQRSEALALRGRNRKTKWTLEFKDVADLSQRRAFALNGNLKQSYEAYLEAYRVDLNYFYPGVCALQMGTLLNDLSSLDGWYNFFNDDNDADRYLTELKKQLQDLQAIIPMAISIHTNENDPDYLWARISAADVLFITETKRENRIIEAYHSAIPDDDLFACDTAKRQLQLFGELGYKKELTEKIIFAIDNKFLVPA
jgi:uncharacterized protein YfcZ (UPF0381/DUF406 family)